VEGVAAWERVTSLAAARQGRLIAELAHRRTWAREQEFVEDEVAARLAPPGRLPRRRLTSPSACT